MKLSCLAAALAFLCSCSASRVPAPAAPGPALDCGAKPAGIDPLIVPGAVTLFGEMHGTAEAPAFVGVVACHARAAGAQVRLLLELPRTLQPAVDAFLGSPGAAGDVAAVLADPFWTGEDGRSSRAMADLLQQARRLGVPVTLFDGTFGSGEARDLGMAANVSAAIDAAPQAVALVLTGNLHARTSTERWMGWHVAKRHPRLRSLNVAYAGGTAWLCMPDGCGSRPLKGADRGSAAFVEWFPAIDEKGHAGTWYVGMGTASPPAR